MAKIKKIWTMDYRPFVMGGNVETPISTKVKVVEERKIRGFGFFCFKTPKGSFMVCESQTGGIIADSFNMLIDNISDCTKKDLQSQIDHAKPIAKKAKELTNEEFFKRYRH